MGPGLRLEMHTHECVACGAGLAHDTPRGAICAQCSMEGLSEAMQAVSDSNARDAAERTERYRAELRERAVGALGVQVSSLEAQGFEVVAAGGTSPTDSELLGPLSGGKVQALLNAGVDMRRIR